MATLVRFVPLLLLAFAASAAEEAAPQQPAPPQLAWKQGPGSIPIGDIAKIELSDQYVALDRAGTEKFMELNQNPLEGNEVAVVAPVSDAEQWFLVFQYDEIGYVKDDERDDLDAAAMLKSIQEGTAQANEERAKRGWSTMEIVGWQEEPHYDTATNNLTWAILGQSEGHKTINKLVKLLGRRGVMTATLVAGTEEFAAASNATNQLLGAYAFQAGNTYAEFAEGDSIAEIGLKGLILGGAGAALIKSGLLGKFWKVLVAGAVALGAGVRRLFGGRSEKSAT
jgi:uncharacterized membrane-anchored protein